MIFHTKILAVSVAYFYGSLCTTELKTMTSFQIQTELYISAQMVALGRDWETYTPKLIFFNVKLRKNCRPVHRHMLPIVSHHLFIPWYVYILFYIT